MQNTHMTANNTHNTDMTTQNKTFVFDVSDYHSNKRYDVEIEAPTHEVAVDRFWSMQMNLNHVKINEIYKA